MAKSHRDLKQSCHRSRRFLFPSELDKLWIWVCGSTLGGGFIRGTPKSISRALGIPVPTFERLMRGQSNFSVTTIENVLNTIDLISEKERRAGDRLSLLSWDSESNTARNEQGRFFARYSKDGAWHYLIGCGNGYRYLACARHAAEKMEALQLNSNPRAIQ